MDAFSGWEMADLLRILVTLAAVFAVVALAMLVRKSLAFGAKPIYAPAKGESGHGVFYSFVTGMLPWKKESAVKHLPTYVAGIFYHLATFLSLFALGASFIRYAPSFMATKLWQFTLLLGLTAGLWLFAKRILLRRMRVISIVDDFLANFLVNCFVAAALATSLSSRNEAALFITAAALFVYVPLGKIRHCVFFFFSRYFWGVFCGRRAVLPPVSE